jgi:hypothetical protein
LLLHYVLILTFVPLSRKHRRYGHAKGDGKCVDVALVVDFGVFVAEALFHAQQWYMVVDIVQRLSAVTDAAFARRYLPYAAYAQEEIVDNTQATLTEHRDSLDLMCLLYERRARDIAFVRARRRSQVRSEPTAI